jgi:dTDP-4-dehydrorhamnose reductase
VPQETSNTMTPIAVIGAAGQLGGWLCQLLGDRARPFDLPGLDITDRDAVLRMLLAMRPAAVVNCAAYTNVDRAEHESDICFAVNATAVKYLAEAAAELDCPLVQISTDYVFGNTPGDNPRPWRETDVPEPRGVYAESKRAGELAALRAPRHIVLRTCGLYGHPTLVNQGRNFVEAILRKAERGESLRVVRDQVCSPSFARDVAETIVWLLDAEFTGTVHVTNAGATSWYEFARSILALRGLSVPIEAISTAEYNAPAPRPAYSALDGAKYASLRGAAMPSIQNALGAYLTWRESRKA